MMASDEKSILGWREWVGLPAIGIERIKCKVDTGARTSALHAFFVEPIDVNGEAWVRFGIHPLQRRNDVEQICECRLVDERVVTDSGGHREKRFVIATDLKLADTVIPVELTLTDRDTMQFRMLLGRTAIRDGYVVDPGRSYLLGRPKRKKKKGSTGAPRTD